MNQEIKAQWTAALRSGEYKQGRFALRSKTESGTERFCCLGVLCELAVAAGVTPEPVIDAGVTEYRYRDEDGQFTHTAFLPDDVAEWAGIVDRDGRSDREGVLTVVDGRKKYSLSTANDCQKLSFEQIADIIEEKF